MAFSKVVLNGTTLIDLTQDTASAETIKTSYTAHDKSGIQVTGTYNGDGVAFPTFDVTFDDNLENIVAVTCNMTYAGCYALINDAADGRASAYVHDQSQIDYNKYYINGNTTMLYADSIKYTFGYPPEFDVRYYSNGTITWTFPSAGMVIEGTPTATKGSVSNHSISVTPSVTNPSGYINGGTKTGSPVNVSASELVSGTYTVGSSGTHDVTNYESISVASGSATTPATTITANPSISVSSSGLITATTSASRSVTPTVSSGYVSSGTSGTITVSGSNTQQLTTKSAQTYTPTTTNQTIASGQYLTGTQTIQGDSNLVGSNILSGKSIFGVSGTVAFQTYYTGSSAPSSSLGVNGDIYLQS